MPSISVNPLVDAFNNFKAIFATLCADNCVWLTIGIGYYALASIIIHG